MKILARDVGALGNPALCARSGGLYARTTVLVGKWGANEGQVLWKPTALSKFGAADEMVTRATVVAAERAWLDTIQLRRAAIWAAQFVVQFRILERCRVEH